MFDNTKNEYCSFNKIWSAAYDRTSTWEQDYKDGIFESLNRGTAILQSQAQLDHFLLSFGLMHQAKLINAFKSIDAELLHQKSIQIIDYGCGQAMGAINFNYHFRSLIDMRQITDFKLIEPSGMALNKGLEYLSDCHKTAKIELVEKKLEALDERDLRTNPNAIKVHIFSNILDINGFDIETLCQKIKTTQSGENYFICVSPDQPWRNHNHRIDQTCNLLGLDEGSLISEFQGKVVPHKNWTVYGKVFSTHL